MVRGANQRFVGRRLGLGRSADGGNFAGSVSLGIEPAKFTAEPASSCFIDARLRHQLSIHHTFAASFAGDGGDWSHAQHILLTF